MERSQIWQRSKGKNRQNRRSLLVKRWNDWKTKVQLDSLKPPGGLRAFKLWEGVSLTTLSNYTYVFINNIQITVTYTCKQTFVMHFSVLHTSWRVDQCVCARACPCVRVCLAGEVASLTAAEMSRCVRTVSEHWSLTTLISACTESLSQSGQCSDWDFIISCLRRRKGGGRSKGKRGRAGEKDSHTCLVLSLQMGLPTACCPSSSATKVYVRAKPLPSIWTWQLLVANSSIMGA